jgi:hypothetical protein
MKHFLLFALLVFSFQTANAQGVKIGVTPGNPDASSILELQSTAHGLLPPRMNTAQRDAILNPANGLMIYNTDTDCMQYYRGQSNGWYSTCPVAPTVNTSSVTSITGITASSGGNVVNDGGASVMARGICWDMNPSPDLSDSFTTDGNGSGAFVSTLTGLTPGTTYFVRAYATNNVGTSFGNEVSFATPLPPVLTTASATGIGETTATTGGNITDDGGAAVTSRGVCWSTSPNPTVLNTTTTNGSGLGAYTANLTGLTPGATYYLRAYAVNAAGTSYGNEITFTTLIAVPIIGAGTGYPGTQFSSSTTLGDQRTPDKAFDNSLNEHYNCWHSASGDYSNSWIKVQFPAARTITLYRMWRRTGNDHIPHTWAFEGSNDNVNWTVLDTRVGDTPPNVSSDSVSGNSYGQYSIASPGSFVFYRLRSTQTISNQYTVIGELEYIGY